MNEVDTLSDDEIGVTLLNTDKILLVFSCKIIFYFLVLGHRDILTCLANLNKTPTTSDFVY